MATIIGILAGILIIVMALVAIVDIIFGCKHQWEIIKDVECGDGYGAKWTRYHLQCSKCGDVKLKDMT